MSNSSEEQGSGALPKKPGAVRPSLLGSPAAERPPGDDSVSILSAVTTDPKTKPGSSAARASSPWMSRGLLLLGFLVVVGILFISLRDREAGATATPVALAQPPAPVPPTAATPEASKELAAAPPPQAQAGTDADAPTTAAAATIESAPSAIESPPAPVAAASSAPAKMAPMKAGGPLAAALASAAPSSKTETGKRQAADARTSRPAAASSASPTAVARDRARKSEDRLLSALNQSASSGKPSEQRDVDLIEALLAHAGAAPASKLGASKAAPAPRTLPGGPKVALSSATPRDIAERKPGASTADLIRKCEDFGVLEGLLCRIRICSDLWGKDAACPAQAAPPGARP